MDFREMTRRVFRREPIPHVLFQPRIEPWYAWHHKFGKMPARYRDLSLLGLFDDLGASMRYMQYYTGVPHPIRQGFDEHVNTRDRREGRTVTRVIETPHGELVNRNELTIDETWRTVEFPVKTSDDLVKLRWLYEHTEYCFDGQAFDVGDAYIGERGVPQFFLPKSPYQALAQQWMKLEDLIYALADQPAVVEDTMKAIDAAYDPLYEQLCGAGRLEIANFGENLHEQLMSPAYFEKYLLPFYARRAGQLKAAGVYSHVHIDGYFRGLLPRLKDIACDGIEALTPEPQGDMTLEQIREHLGDKVLLDGIPAVLFLDRMYSRDQLMACVEKLVELFHPNLVLGISDEIPEGCGEEGMERVRMVAQWCRAHSG
jgi:hypothetical protein